MGNHILLAEAPSLTQRLNAPAKALEESGFVLHDLFVSDRDYKDHVSFMTWYN